MTDLTKDLAIFVIVDAKNLMHMTQRSIGICFAFLTIAVRPSAAETPGDLAVQTLTEHLNHLRIDEITRTSAAVVVRGKRIEANGRFVPGQLIICDLYGPDQWYLAFQDHTLRTDDWWNVEHGFCNVVFAAARQRQDAHER